MHNQIVLDRIQNQRQRLSQPVKKTARVIDNIPLSPIVPLDELKTILMNELGEKVQPEKCEEILSVHFENIYDFCSWYAEHQNDFSEMQRAALDTVLQTRSLIESGCACRRASREAMAHDYFAQFWTNNSKTDLLMTIAKITGAAKVSINSYCSYPSEPV
jgi:hypothetical protein